MSKVFVPGVGVEVEVGAELVNPPFSVALGPGLAGRSVGVDVCVGRAPEEEVLLE